MSYWSLIESRNTSWDGEGGGMAWKFASIAWCRPVMLIAVLLLTGRMAYAVGITVDLGLGDAIRAVEIGISAVPLP